MGLRTCEGGQGVAGVEGVRREAADRVIDIETVKVPELRLRSRVKCYQCRVADLCVTRDMHTGRPKGKASTSLYVDMPPCAVNICKH